MEYTATDQARRLSSVKKALFQIAGAFSWSLFWENKHTALTVDGHHEDHVFEHMWAFSRGLDTGEILPVNLGSAQLRIFEETVSVLTNLFSLSYFYPSMNIRREAHARICFALGRAIQSVRDVDFTANALEFIVCITSDVELKAAVDDAILESKTSQAYDPKPFIDLIPQSYRSLATKAFLSGLNAPADVSAVYFPVMEWVQWQ